MKVNFLKKKTLNVGSLKVGETFLTRRRTSKEDGLYMVIDSNSGLTSTSVNSTLAVNLESGQLRKFTNVYEVEPIEAEVSILKNER